MPSSLPDQGQGVSAEELFSAAYDHVNAADDRAVALESTSEQLSPDVRESLLRDWTSLRHSLRRIPVTPVNGLREAIRRELNDGGRDVAVPTVDGHRATGRQQYRWVALVVSLAMICLFSVRLNLRERPQHASGLELADTGSVTLSDQSVPSAAMPADAVIDGAGVASGVSAEPDWQIVIVTIEDDFAESTKESLQTLATKQGLSVEQLSHGPVDMPEFPLGILLASENDSTELLGSLSSQDQLSKPEWNPVRVSGIDSSELKRRFLHAMRSPTRSDAYFGEMYTVVPRSAADQLVIARLEPAKVGVTTDDRQAAAAFSNPRAIRVDESTGGPDSAAGDLTAGGMQPRPVLVVFRTQRATEEPRRVGPDQGRLERHLPAEAGFATVASHIIGRA